MICIVVYSSVTVAKLPATDEAITLKYDSALTRDGFSSPMVEVKIDDNHTGIFLIDTGASSNVMASWFSKKLPTDHKSDLTIPDSTGQKIKVSLFQSDMRIAKKSFQKQTFLIADFPEDFEKNQIAGIISPKTLGLVVAVDFKMPRLIIKDSVEQMMKDLNIDIIPRAQQTTCLAASSSMYVVEVMVHKQKMKLLVDSGSATTKIFRLSPGGQVLKGIAKKTEKQTAGLSGRKVDLLQLPESAIQFAGYETVANIFIQDSAGKGCPSEGLLGMDLLKNCTVVMAKEDIGISCR